VTQKLVLASGNAGKLREFQTLLGTIGMEVVSQQSLDVPECDEPYGTFLENALHKARHASRITGLPALADDSGICANALDGRPGVYSARYSLMDGEFGKEVASKEEIDAANNRKLVEAVEQCADKSAFYYCVLVLVTSALDAAPLIADGLWPGRIVAKPVGLNGFGYDPHFLLPEFGKTAAELTVEEKNRVSHRALATHALIAKLNARNAQS
jgi:XTP/dITP diphosphohydrolase